jgi:hypothetical protein
MKEKTGKKQGARELAQKTLDPALRNLDWLKGS